MQDKKITFNNYEEKIGKLNEKVKNYKGLLKNMKENNKISFDLSDIDEEDEDEDENEEENKEEIEEINVDE